MDTMPGPGTLMHQSIALDSCFHCSRTTTKIFLEASRCLAALASVRCAEQLKFPFIPCLLGRSDRSLLHLCCSMWAHARSSFIGCVVVLLTAVSDATRHSLIQPAASQQLYLTGVVDPVITSDDSNTRTRGLQQADYKSRGDYKLIEPGEGGAESSRWPASTVKVWHMHVPYIACMSHLLISKHKGRLPHVRLSCGTRCMQKALALPF